VRRDKARSRSMSSAFWHCAIVRIAWWMRPPPSRVCATAKAFPSPPRTASAGTRTDRCPQLFGGYGYITQFPIARLYAHARVTRIYSGTSEVMKSIISKSMGL